MAMAAQRAVVLDARQTPDEVWHNLCGSMGLECVGRARSVEETVRLAESFRPDVLLMTDHTAGSDGTAQAEELRRRCAIPAIPVARPGECAASAATPSKPSAWTSVVDGRGVMAFRWRAAPGFPVEYVSENVRHLGYTADDLRSGRVSWVGITHPDDVPRLEQELLRHHQQGVYEFPMTYRLRDASGALRTFEDWTRAVRDADGNITHYESLVWEISDPQRAAELRRNSEASLRAILSSSMVGYVLLDPEGRVQGFNRRAQEMSRAVLGRPLEEGCTAVDIMRGDTLARFLANFRRAASGESFTIERHIANERGDECWVEIQYTPVLSEHGQVVGVCMGALDRTDRKRAEAERRALEQQVQHAQKIESIGVLAGGIAHDFNNLLTAILGHANLALRRLPPDAPVREGLVQVEQAALRAADLTRQLLAYSGKGRVVTEAIDLNALLRDMGRLIEASVARGVRIRFEFAETTPPFEGDPFQVRQVVMNLVANASESIGRDGGTVEIRTDLVQCGRDTLQAALVGRDRPEGRYVALRVSDTGCGMDAATQARMFDPFFSTKFLGRGLGLAAVQGILTSHKGVICVSSAPGRGSAVTCLFPLPVASAAPSVCSDADLDAWKAKGFVLLVDDEATVLQVARMMLEHLGFRVLAASNGKEAVETYRARRSEILCVLLDLTMPQMDGAAAFDALRAIAPDVRVIFSSGYDEQDVAGRLAGPHRPLFIQKPYRVDTLTSRLKECLTSGGGTP